MPIGQKEDYYEKDFYDSNSRSYNSVFGKCLDGTCWASRR